MKFDWSINMGNILTAAILLVGFITAHMQNVRKLQDIETKVGIMFRWFNRRIIGSNGEEQS